MTRHLHPTASVLLCCGCDEIRDQERAFCHGCGEATNSYPYEPTAREAFAYDRLIGAGRIVAAPLVRDTLTEAAGDPGRAMAA